MRYSREVASVVIALGLFYRFCGRGEDFNIQIQSPQRTYNVVLTGKKTPGKALPGEFYVQDVRLVASKENNVLATDERFYHTDEYDSLFLEAYPVQEWISNSVLRLGNANAQPFKDEIMVVNKTAENIDLLVVNYGKYERFLLFDLGPGSSLKLQASPQFEREWPGSSVSYTAYSKGISSSGATEGVRQRKQEEGPLKTTVEILKNR